MSQPTDEQRLLSEIETFLKPEVPGGKPRMAESTFGFKAANDGKLISRLRDGKTMTFEKARQIRAYIAAADVPRPAETAGVAA